MPWFGLCLRVRDELNVPIFLKKNQKLQLDYVEEICGSPQFTYLKSLEISDPYTYIHIDISSQKAKLFDFKAEC